MHNDKNIICHILWLDSALCKVRAIILLIHLSGTLVNTNSDSIHPTLLYQHPLRTNVKLGACCCYSDVTERETDKLEMLLMTCCTQQNKSEQVKQLVLDPDALQSPELNNLYFVILSEHIMLSAQVKSFHELSTHTNIHFSLHNIPLCI